MYPFQNWWGGTLAITAKGLAASKDPGGGVAFPAWWACALPWMAWHEVGRHGGTGRG